MYNADFGRPANFGTNQFAHKMRMHDSDGSGKTLTPHPQGHLETTARNQISYQSTRRGNTADEKELVLAEFADPDGRTTYFNLPDLDAAEDDELKHVDTNP